MKKKSISFTLDELVEIWSGLDAVVNNAHCMIKINKDKELHFKSLRACYSASNKVQRAICKLRDEHVKKSNGSVSGHDIASNQSGFKIINT